MKTLRVISFAVCLSLVGFALTVTESSASVPDDGEIVETLDYKFPSYDEAVRSTDTEKYSSKREYDLAVGDKEFQFQKITYLSDGLKVKAYLYKSASGSKKKCPAIIFNRGSFIRGDIAPELITMFHRLARGGFVVIAPMYRQSDGGEGRDRLGGEDMNDLMNVLPLVSALEFIDTGNLFMYGESRGGMMTYQAIRKGFPLKAAAVFGAFTDLEELMKWRPEIYTEQLAKTIWRDFEPRKDEIIRTRSAIRWTRELKTPLLIMHGGNDKSVNPEQSLRIASELLRHGNEFGLFIYPGDNHILSRNRRDRDERTLKWFKQFLIDRPKN